MNSFCYVAVPLRSCVVHNVCLTVCMCVSLSLSVCLSVCLYICVCPSLRFVPVLARK